MNKANDKDYRLATKSVLIGWRSDAMPIGRLRLGRLSIKVHEIYQEIKVGKKETRLFV